MSVLWWTLAGIYLAGVALFAFVGVARTPYRWWIVVTITALWPLVVAFCVLHSRREAYRGRWGR
jgi:hypothetical protein